MAMGSCGHRGTFMQRENRGFAWRSAWVRVGKRGMPARALRFESSLNVHVSRVLFFLTEQGVENPKHVAVLLVCASGPPDSISRLQDPRWLHSNLLMITEASFNALEQQSAGSCKAAKVPHSGPVLSLEKEGARCIIYGCTKKRS